MRKPSIRALGLLAGVPLLVGLLIGAAALTVLGGDEPVSDADPPGPPVTPVTGTVIGTVFGPTGEPVAEANVIPRSLDTPAQPVPELGVITGPAGRYEWHLRAGRYELVAGTADRAGTPREVTVTAGATATLDLEVP